LLADVVGDKAGPWISGEAAESLTRNTIEATARVRRLAVEIARRTTSMI